MRGRHCGSPRALPIRGPGLILTGSPLYVLQIKGDQRQVVVALAEVVRLFAAAVDRELERVAVAGEPEVQVVGGLEVEQHSAARFGYLFIESPRRMRAHAALGACGRRQVLAGETAVQNPKQSLVPLQKGQIQPGDHCRVQVVVALPDSNEPS